MYVSEWNENTNRKERYLNDEYIEKFQKVCAFTQCHLKRTGKATKINFI